MSERYDRRDFLRLMAGGMAGGAGLVALGCAAPARGAGPAAAGAAPTERLVRAHIHSNSFTRPPELFATRLVGDLRGFRPAAGARLSRFGGSMEQSAAASGFFRVEKQGNRWWLRDPDGHRFLHVAVNSVSPKRNFGSEAAFRQKFGSDEAWAAETAGMLRELGYNGTGSWSADALLTGAPAAVRPAYTPNANFMASYGRRRGGTYQKPGHIGYPNDAIFVFDPEFESFCDEHAQRLAATATDPWLLGHFTDNEMPLGPRLIDGYLRMPEGDPGRQAALHWLAERGASPDSISDAMREEFRGHVADRYFSIVTKAIRKYDPNHLILGSRFYGSEKDSEAVFRAVGRHVDVVAVNVYSEWTPNYERFARWERWSGRPVLATEWYAKGDDSGLPNLSGAGWTVATQQERGWFYQNFTLGLLQSGVCVGWHWFKYLDNDPTDTTVDPSNRDSNKGMLKIDYEPYTPLTDAMRELNRNVYALAAHFDRQRTAG